eukprot:scaffold16641_cov186-Skeletonema_dohrnii-CCMP3373.AAC.1
MHRNLNIKYLLHTSGGFAIDYMETDWRSVRVEDEDGGKLFRVLSVRELSSFILRQVASVLL